MEEVCGFLIVGTPFSPARVTIVERNARLRVDAILELFGQMHAVVAGSVAGRMSCREGCNCTSFVAIVARAVTALVL